MKNLLTQWELKRKTDPKLEPWGYYFFLTFLVERQVAGPTLANPDGLPSSSGQCSYQYWWHTEGRPLFDLCHQASTLAKPDDILKVAARHLASTLTNTDDEVEDLAVHRQACIYGSDSTSPISYPGLKAVQPCRVFIWVLR